MIQDRNSTLAHTAAVGLVVHHQQAPGPGGRASCRGSCCEPQPAPLPPAPPAFKLGMAPCCRPPLACALLALLLASSSPRQAAAGVVTWTELTDDSLSGVLEGHQIVVLAGCWSEEACADLGEQLSKAASILGRVALADSSMALGSVALHDTAATAETAGTYRLAEKPMDSSPDEPRCVTRVVIGGVEVDAETSPGGRRDGLTDDDGKPPLVSTLVTPHAIIQSNRNTMQTRQRITHKI